ncbi:MAG: DnaJ domain-containing protein [Endozoicomonas sp.]
MPHDIGSTHNSVAIDANTFNSADAAAEKASATGMTRDGRSVRAFNRQEPFLLAIRGSTTPRRGLNTFSVTTTEPPLTFNDPKKQTPSMAATEAAPAQVGLSHPKMSSKFLQGAVDRLINKGYSKTEAENLLQGWLDQPGATMRSVKRRVLNAPYKDMARQEVFDRVTSDLLRMGFNTQSARRLAEGIVLTMSHPADEDKSVVAAPSGDASEKANVEDVGAKDSTSKKQGLRTRMKELLIDRGYEEQEAKNVINEVVNSLGGWKRCDKKQFKNIIKGIPDKEAAPNQNLTREEALSILKLEASASPDNIKKAYRKLALKHHPDKHVGAEPAVQEKHRNVFEKAQQAYDRLTK